MSLLIKIINFFCTLSEKWRKRGLKDDSFLSLLYLFGWLITGLLVIFLKKLVNFIFYLTRYFPFSLCLTNQLRHYRHRYLYRLCQLLISKLEKAPEPSIMLDAYKDAYFYQTAFMFNQPIENLKPLETLLRRIETENSLAPQSIYCNHFDTSIIRIFVPIGIWEKAERD